MLVQDIDVYKKSHNLTLNIYRLTSVFPQNEVYGLTSQMRRAAVSINSNLAEGGARRSLKDKIHFIIMARGSVAELDYQCMLARDLQYLKSEVAQHLICDARQIGQMLSGIIKKHTSNE